VGIQEFEQKLTAQKFNVKKTTTRKQRRGIAGGETHRRGHGWKEELGRKNEWASVSGAGHLGYVHRFGCVGAEGSNMWGVR
jgi:hypothetical protein